MRCLRTTLGLCSRLLRSRCERNMNAVRPAALALLVLLATAYYANAQGGTWTPLNNPFPGCATDAALLRTDGRVLEHDYCSATGDPYATDWYTLTPDGSGSYINGTWTQVAPIPAGFRYGPFAFDSAVLPDGRVIVEGGEYNRNGFALNQGAIYDPVANTWTQVIPPDFGDMCDQNGQISTTGETYWCDVGESPSLVLADGSFMVGNHGYTSSYPYLSKLEALLPPPYTGPWI